jgi:nucleotide-binding universal stress UspA family protein
MRIERILCPTDLTPDSKAALRYAVALAHAYDAQLIQMYCHDSSDNPDTLKGKPV